MSRMDQVRRTRVHVIKHMRFNKDKTISMYESDADDECIIRLPKTALEVMIQYYEIILCDLEENNDRLRRYWYQPGTDIYSSSKFDQVRTESGEMLSIRNLYIRQPSLEMILSANAFQSTILTAIILLRHQEEQFVTSSPYKLNSLKTVTFNAAANKFFIFDTKKKLNLALPIRALAIMIANKIKFLDDLRVDEGDESPYWLEQEFTIKPCRPLVMLKTEKADSAKILLNEYAFKTVLQIALIGTKATTAEMEEFRARNPCSVPINSVRSIKFSDDDEKFTLIDELNCVALNLPMKILNAMLTHETQILADLGKEILLKSASDRDYINEYWTNGKYALRTDLFLNVYGEVNCNVVSVMESMTNTLLFAIQEKAFREILNIYRSSINCEISNFMDCDVKIETEDCTSM